ncbi:MAG: hypothetical protein H0W24_06355 [Lysobacter sp.]|nr:hypothetical protein [Lysobacter sp.]
MRTYDVFEDGECKAFEIENAYVTPRTLASILGGMKEVANVRLRKPFDKSGEVHLRFEFRGTECVIWEPFGDSSRYWIGPDNSEIERVDLCELKAEFERYRPSIAARIVGDLLRNL